MGQWNISIHGTGSHHNKKHPIDANRMAAAFIQALKDAGHTVTHATFTHGGEEVLTDSATYLADKSKQDASG